MPKVASIVQGGGVVSLMRVREDHSFAQFVVVNPIIERDERLGTGTLPHLTEPKDATIAQSVLGALVDRFDHQSHGVVQDKSGRELAVLFRNVGHCASGTPLVNAVMPQAFRQLIRRALRPYNVDSVGTVYRRCTVGLEASYAQSCGAIKVYEHLQRSRLKLTL